MYCAFDKARVCSSDCTAYAKDEEVRESEWVWDTCLNEYVQKWTTIQQGIFCRRLGYLINKIKIIEQHGKEME